MGGHARQTDEDNRAGGEGSRPKRKGARTVQNGSAKVILLGGGGRMPAWARKKKDKYYDSRDGRQGGQGQDRELYPILHLIGEVLHCSTPPTPKKAKPKKRKNTDREQKKWFGEGLVGWDSKNKTTDRRVVVDF